ncbi:hypothetical protein D9M72_495760 [compost metagenome]
MAPGAGATRDGVPAGTSAVPAAPVSLPAPSSSGAGPAARDGTVAVAATRMPPPSSNWYSVAVSPRTMITRSGREATVTNMAPSSPIVMTYSPRSMVRAAAVPRVASAVVPCASGAARGRAALMRKAPLNMPR